MGGAEGCAEPLVLRTSPLASVMTASVGLVPSHGFISGMDEKPWKSGATMVSIVRLLAWRRTKRVDEIDASKRSASSIDFPRMLKADTDPNFSSPGNSSNCSAVSRSASAEPAL